MKRALLALTLLAAASPSVEIPSAPADKAQIVLYRGSSVVGAAIPCDVQDENGRPVVTLYRGRYARITTSPDHHTYGGKGDPVGVDAKAGQTYYLSCTIGAGIVAGRAHVHESGSEAFAAKSGDFKEVAGVDGQ